MNNPLLAFKHKKFNASHYKQPPSQSHHQLQPPCNEYGPFITNDQLLAMNRLPIAIRTLKELENKIYKNKKYMLEQYEDRDITLHWLPSPDHYYQLALTYQCKLETQLDKQQRLVSLLKSKLL